MRAFSGARTCLAGGWIYENNLGFTVDWGGDELGLAGISKGRCRMFLANSDYRKEYGNIGPVLTWLNLESKEEVDNLYRLWSASKAKLISAPESKPWGLHEFTATDPDGNLFASSMTSRLQNGPKILVAPAKHFAGSLGRVKGSLRRSE